MSSAKLAAVTSDNLRHVLRFISFSLNLFGLQAETQQLFIHRQQKLQTEPGQSLLQVSSWVRTTDLKPADTRIQNQ